MSNELYHMSIMVNIVNSHYYGGHNLNFVLYILNLCGCIALTY